MIRLQQVKIPLVESGSQEEVQKKQMQQLEKKIRKILGLKQKEELISFQVLKRSLDARKKPQLFYLYVVDVVVKKEEMVFSRYKGSGIEKIEPKPYQFPKERKSRTLQPIVVGTGPAGLFCAYFLAKYGYRPIVLERGKAVDDRRKDVAHFWQTGNLDPESNVQFGEGGAGTFSDGKLNTLVKEKLGRNREVLKILTRYGAPREILYDSKPHIGTDILGMVVKGMREQIQEWGGEVHFQTKMEELLIEQERIVGVKLADGRVLPADAVVLAVGHSARDTFAMCEQKQVPMKPKPFAVGYRVEHPQELINLGQYGESCIRCLPTASYKLAMKSESGRGVYSFCMCPGGYVVNASSEPGRLTINGMSYSGRKGKNANSAILVSVSPKDFGGDGPLAGVAFQRRLEEKAYQLGQGKIPVQYYKDFKQKAEHQGQIEAGFLPAMKGEYQFTQVREILPEKLNEVFIQGMEHFHRLIPGFADDYVCVSGIESRTSSPIRMIRDEYGQSVIRGLYPCGEGAGYAGGITSAAMDGIFIAEMVAKG